LSSRRVVIVVIGFAAFAAFSRSLCSLRLSIDTLSRSLESIIPVQGPILSLGYSSEETSLSQVHSPSTTSTSKPSAGNMSSDDDSDSSDDDLLGGASIFSTSSRAQALKDKKDEKFLENQLAKEAERAERKRRIADAVHAEKEARAAAAAAADASDGGGEEGAADAELNGSNSASGASSGVSFSSVMSSKKRRGKMPTYDDDDPEYWRRVSELSRSSGNTAEGRAKRQREIYEKVDGVDDLSDEEKGDGSPEDMRRRQALASAKDIGQSTCLGTRRMFLPAVSDAPGVATTAGSELIPSRPESDLPFGIGSVSTFASSAVALTELKTIIDSLIKSAGKKGTTEQKRAERDLRDSILKPIKAASEGGSVVLSAYLSQKSLLVKCSEASLPVPRQLVAWLFTTSCSVSTTRTMATGAYLTLLEIMKARLRIVELGQEDDEAGDALKIAYMTDLIAGLERLFRLWTKNGASPAMKEEVDPSDYDSDTRRKKPKRPRKSFLDNASGLAHFLALWATALDYDYIMAAQALENDMSKASATAAAALAKASLDAIFQSGNHELNNSLKWLLVSLVEHNALRLNSKGRSGTDDEVRQLFSAMAHAVCDACSDLSCGLPKSADEDDINGWLPFALAVRMLPIEHCYGTPSLAAMRFKATVAEFALQECLQFTDSWDMRLESEFKHYSKNLDDKSLSDRWRMMMIAEVGLRRVQSVGDEITSDGPRFLTCVEIVVICAELGMALFSDVDPADDGTGGIYKSIAEADAMSHLLESLENLCTRLKKNIKSVFIYPHLRRVKEVLTLLAVYFRVQKEEASKMAQHRGEVSLTQMTLGWATSGDSQTQPEPSGDSQEE